MNQKEQDILRCKHNTEVTLAEVLDSVWFGDKSEISFYDHDDFEEYDVDSNRYIYNQPSFTLRMNGDLKVASFLKPEWVLGTVTCIQQCDDGVWRAAIERWKEGSE